MTIGVYATGLQGFPLAAFTIQWTPGFVHVVHLKYVVSVGFKEDKKHATVQKKASAVRAHHT